VIIPSLKGSDSSQDMLTNSDAIYSPMTESLIRDRRNSFRGNSVFSSIMRKLKPDMTMSMNDRLNRTSTCCFQALAPTREINHWVNK